MNNTVKVTHFKTVRSAPGPDLRIEDVFNDIKNGTYKEQVMEIRQNLSKKDELKKKLPAFTVSATCMGGRLEENITAYTGLVQLDYDKVNNPEELKSTAIKLKTTLSAFVSPSGNGVKVIVPVDTQKDRHLSAFNAVRDYYDTALGTRSDESVKDLLRLCFVSYDPDLYQNLDATVFEVFSSNKSKDLGEIFKFTSRIISFLPGSRNKFLYRLALNAHNAGVSQSEVESFFFQHACSDFNQKEISKTIASAYKTELKKDAIINQDVTRDFSKYGSGDIIKVLSDNYVFIHSSQIAFKRDDQGNIDFSDYHKFADLLFLLKDLKTRITKVDFEYMLKTKNIIEITPLHLFYNVVSRTAWDGEDYIEKAFRAANIKGDPKVNLYLFRKWILTAYSFGLRGIDPLLPTKVYSRVALIFFSHKRGLGKTEFFRKLGLSNYFEELTKIPGFEIYSELAGGLGKDERRAHAMLTDNLILNVDDVQEMLIKSSGELRSIISNDALTKRPMFREDIKNTKRRAAICGSTNHGEILRQDDENRYFIMEIEDVMDFDLINSIDFMQLWAQARALYLANKAESSFNQSDLNQILNLSKGFTFMSVDEEAVHSCFEYCPNPVKEIPFSEILEVLQINNYHVSANKIGAALKTLAPDGKISKKKNGGKDRFYLVKHRENIKVPNSWIDIDF